MLAAPPLLRGARGERYDPRRMAGAREEFFHVAARQHYRCAVHERMAPPPFHLPDVRVDEQLDSVRRIVGTVLSSTEALATSGLTPT